MHRVKEWVSKLLKQLFDEEKPNRVSETYNKPIESTKDESTHNASANKDLDDFEATSVFAYKTFYDYIAHRLLLKEYRGFVFLKKIFHTDSTVNSSDFLLTTLVYLSIKLIELIYITAEKASNILVRMLTYEIYTRYLCLAILLMTLMLLLSFRTLTTKINNLKK